MAVNVENSADPIIGRKLGDFLVKEKLGEGGFGAVYKATQIILARKAVIKILHTRHRTNLNILERFKREAHLASRLEHPYCAHVYSFGAEPDGLLWIAMEMVQGTPLDTWLKLNGAMPLNRFVPLFDKICEVVHTAHELGIIHRDIKPANIMVISRAGRLLPKLLDFGIAKDLSLITNSETQSNSISQQINNSSNSESDSNTEEKTLLSDSQKSPDISPDISAVTALQKNTNNDLGKKKESDSEDSNIVTLISEDVRKKNVVSNTALDNDLINSNEPITHTKGVVGSPRYMSPEQWKGTVKVGIPSDIYALGVTAYEILTSKAPFKGSGIALMTAHLNDPVPTLGTAFAEKLSEVIAKAMAKDPKERYQSALEFAQELKIAVSLNEEQYNLPQLNSLLLSEILNDAPKPIAESVANLNAARNAFQLRDNILVVFRVVIRYLGLLALISHSNIKLVSKDPENILVIVKKLRSSGLSESEWINFIQVLCSPFANQKDLHPIPELVSLFLTSDNQLQKKLNDSLTTLLYLSETRNIIKKEENLAQDLVPVLEALTNILSSVSFLNNYYLVIPNDEIQSIGEKWMGAIKLNRTKISLKGKNFSVDHPILTDVEGNILISLWPLVQIGIPSLGQSKELFLLEGKGRQTAKLISLPSGFEKENEMPWQWLKEVFFTEEEKQTTLVTEKSPYPGLSTFRSENADLFYGREREIESVLNRLKITPFLAIIGPSGAGKSSFVQAGIIPNLGKNWLTITLRPSVAPIANLLAKLNKEGIDTNSFEYLKNDEKFLSYVLRNVAKDKNVSILLVIDQFEELFTLCSDRDEQQLYAKYLSKAACSEEEPIRIIISLRDDFLIKVKSLPGLQDKITQNLELLTTPEATDLLRILVEPAKRLNYLFEDPELPKEIVQSVKQEASALPLLAFTAAKLWEFRDQQFKQLRRKTYESMGGVGGALARHAESMIEQMSQSERSLVKEAFRHLVTSEGTRTTLTRQELLELLGNNKDSEIVLEKLINNRLLVSAEGEKGIERIELVHEALLSSWPRLISWRQEMAEGARLRDQLRIAAQQWQERTRPKGLLWRDEALQEYQLWRERYQGKLTNLEEEFASMSLLEATYSQRLKRRLVVSAITILVFGIALLFYQQQRTKAQLLETLELYEEQGRQEMLKSNLDGAAVYLSEAYAKGKDSLALKYMLSVALAKAEDRPTITLSNHTDIITMATFSPNNILVVTTSRDKTARIWQAIDGKELFVLTGHQDAVTFANFSPDSKYLVTASLDKTARLWDTTTGNLITTFNSHSDGLLKAIFRPDGKQVVTISYDHNAKIWDSVTGKLINDLVGHKGAIYSVCYSPDGKTIATAGVDKTINIWDSVTGKLKNTLIGHKSGIIAIAFSPDNQFFISASSDETAKVWQVAEGKLIHSLKQHQLAVTDAKFSPDGKTILTTSSDSKAYLCEMETGKITATLEGHTADIINGNFSPDGKLIITNSYDGTLRIWERITGRFLVALVGHKGPLSSGNFDYQGKKVITASEDKEAKIWQIEVENRPPLEILAIVKEKVPFYLQDGRLIAKEQAKTEVTNEKVVINNDNIKNETYIEALGENIELEMVKIPGGVFEMGSPATEKDHNNDEKLHKVQVSDFYLGKYEITQAQWRVVAALPAINIHLKADPAKFKGELLPVESISWDEAIEFCARLSKATGNQYRLPTEAEWEYAARAGNKNEYPDNLEQMAWYDKNSETKTHVVGQKQPNPWGLYDIYGNIYEFCNDWYGEYPESFVVDPKGANSGDAKVVRGGSWYYPNNYCRSALRNFIPTNRSLNYLGFRIVKVIK